MPCRRTFLLAVDLAAVLLFSGVVFGWTSLQQLLLNEGFYSALCAPGLPRPCDAQKTALNRAFTLASTAVSFVALPGGVFLDRFGPFRTILIAGAVELLGLVGIAVSEQIGSTHFDVFLVSLVAIAVGGSLTMFCGYSIAFLFPERSSLVLGLTSCFFDGSCIIFPIVKLVYDAGATFDSLFWAYIGLAGVVYGLLIVAWRLNAADFKVLRSSMAAEDSSQGAEGLAGLPIGQQVRSPEFLAICVFASVQLTRSNVYLGSVGLVNEQIAQDSGTMSALPSVATVIGLVIPFGFLVVPLFTGSLGRFGLLGTVQVTNALGLLYNGLQFVPSLYCQLATVAVFTTWRAFLFSIISDFNAQTFGIRSMGTIQGVCFLAGAFVNLGQAPLVSMSVGKLGSNFRPLLLVSLLAAVPLPLPWEWVRRWQAGRRSREPVEAGASEAAAAGGISPSSLARSSSLLREHSTACGTSTHCTIAAALGHQCLQEDILIQFEHCK